MGFGLKVHELDIYYCNFLPNHKRWKRVLNQHVNGDLPLENGSNAPVIMTDIVFASVLPRKILGQSPDSAKQLHIASV